MRKSVKFLSSLDLPLVIAVVLLLGGNHGLAEVAGGEHTTAAPPGLAGRAFFSDPGVERLRTDVSITVDGSQRVARFEVEEQFRNNSHRMLEGDYLYPIPKGAVFTDFSLFMGEQELKGEMLSAPLARGIYEEIVRRKKDPALIELVGNGLLRARVFPIAAGETRRVVLRYTQVLPRDGHMLRLRYPRVVGMVDAGEAPGLAAGGDLRRRERASASGPAPQESPPFALTMRVRDAGLFATPYSPTHRIEIRDAIEGVLEIGLSLTSESPRDFELFLPLREDSVGAAVVSHAMPGEPGYYMMLVSPPAAGDTLSIPRDLTLVLDVSGSMAGDKIAQARAALDQILAGLGDADRFRVVTYSSVVRSFRTGWANATDDEISAARLWLGGIGADGGTNIEAALREALRPETRRGRMAQIVFLTDGKPTVGETSVEQIVAVAESMADGERLFAFGVGHDVNTYLLDALAVGGRGSVGYVGPAESVEEAVSSLGRKIRHPALTDLRVVEAPVFLEDRYPQVLPDLFFGEDLVLLGRYRSAGAGPLVIEGQRAGRLERFEFDVVFRDRESENAFIPKLWAARKAGVLTTQVRLHGADPELVEEIRQLGLRYGILTEYTAYLVEEPNMTLDDATLREVMGRAREQEEAMARQTGRVAFEAAKASSARRDVDTLQQALRVPVAAAAPVAGVTGTRPESDAAGEVASDAPGDRRNSVTAEGAFQHVGDRVFVMRSGVWTDLRFSDERVVRLAPFSTAYFELVDRLPEIKPFFALGQRVIIAGDGWAIELAEDGNAEWIHSELAAVLGAFGK